MYLLYLDESGDPDDPADKHFVLGGAAVFERVTFHLARKLDEVQARHFPGKQPIEFHASQMRSGRGFWRNQPRELRTTVLEDIAEAVATSNDPGVVLFAAVVEKDDSVHSEEAVKQATEQVCKRFDVFLKRRYQEADDPQRGLLVFAEGRFHQRARLWVRDFRDLGTRWGVLRNLSDIPYFASTKETRLLQIADFVSHAVFLLYERRDASLIAPILRRFHRADGVVHGLAHRTVATGQCDCPACSSRRNPGDLGSWVQDMQEPTEGAPGQGAADGDLPDPAHPGSEASRLHL